MQVAIAGHLDDALRAVFPSVSFTRTDRAEITARAWRDDGFDFWAFDRRLDETERISVDGAIAGEVLTRAQRRIGRRNAASAEPWFDRVLAAHRELHDTRKPLVRADLDHALDAWQWTLRLDANAPVTVQLATLLHDIERLASEADARIEHTAADYQAFKDAHARAGAQMARHLLAGVDDVIVDETCRLVALHERRSDDAALRLINDADALSFFSLNSPGYLAYFGTEQTRRKVAYTLARMSPAARRELPRVRIPSRVRGFIDDEHGQRA